MTVRNKNAGINIYPERILYEIEFLNRKNIRCNIKNEE